MFNSTSRRHPDPVETDFIKFKSLVPEVHEEICDQRTVSQSFALESLVGNSLSDADASKLARLAPWGYGFKVAPGLSTVDCDIKKNIQTQLGGEEALAEMTLRYSVLCNILQDITQSIDAPYSLLDLATNCGIIPLLLSKRHSFSNILACDISPENIDKAKFLQKLANGESDNTSEDDHVATLNIEFVTKDAYTVCDKSLSSFDIVSALGIFYHLSDPIGLLTKIRATTKHYAIIDTISHNFPFSGWIQTVSRHVKYERLSHANDTRKIVELHPTTRGMVDSLYQVGFNDVSIYRPSQALLENLPAHNVYKTLNRIFFVASVKPLEPLALQLKASLAVTFQQAPETTHARL